MHLQNKREEYISKLMHLLSSKTFSKLKWKEKQFSEMPKLTRESLFETTTSRHLKSGNT